VGIAHTHKLFEKSLIKTLTQNRALHDFLSARKLLSQFPSLNGDSAPKPPQSGVAAFLYARKLLSQFPSLNGALPQAPQSGVAAFY